MRSELAAADAFSAKACATWHFFVGRVCLFRFRPRNAFIRQPTTRSMSSPHIAFRRIRWICTITVAGIWLYQGLVPKLLGPHPDEIAMSEAFGIGLERQAFVSYAAGVCELLMGMCILLAHRHAWPQWVSAVATAALLGFVAIYSPSHLIGAFNPVVMNSASMALSVVAVLALRAETANSA
jgi:hypothetical protein